MATNDATATRSRATSNACPVHERKCDLLKLIADELIVLDQSRERALPAEKRIAAWRDEYDNRT
ncbi:hypothetical protein AN480_28200 (plasmid) [Mycobacterium intracellulare subsp. chimaera]|uniref:Uncharacterized protein n=1 Tax=Mycobacterium intracellulare subsp. chimaera TaxID=222805 RepID=A0ABT7P6K7_MYCIT|nr:hypothetical protein [Mycobacterium intracellulare]AOS94928.1 hypothetical protein AN480_28200 [Mycobacterium intracellulare subsp. chimaera]MDM3928721.1 hypothetical protein [Mycobacterium intracellulare subsp. chimaera]